jgi:cytoskeletal protein CcmA (bactofilin family)
MPALAPTPQSQGEINTLLGRGSSFDGKLTFEGTVRIDGKLSGEIFSNDVLVIGEGAEVNAEIDVGVLIVEGSVTGNIRAKRAVELHAPARVRGNLETPSLFIEKGVMFEGQSRMEGMGAPRATGQGQGTSTSNAPLPSSAQSPSQPNVVLGPGAAPTAKK